MNGRLNVPKTLCTSPPTPLTFSSGVGCYTICAATDLRKGRDMHEIEAPVSIKALLVVFGKEMLMKLRSIGATKDKEISEL